MDIDIIRDQKLGAGAGMRSSRVCVSVMSYISEHSEHPLLYSTSQFAVLCVPAHLG